MDGSVIRFTYPPLPFSLECGHHHYQIGERHVTRYKLGVFVLLVVRKGRLWIGEESQTWELQENDGLILQPDLFHYGAADCIGETDISWIHFSTTGPWQSSSGQDDAGERKLRLLTSQSLVPMSQMDTITLFKQPRLSEPAFQYMDEIAALQKSGPGIALWNQQMLFHQLLHHLNAEVQPGRERPEAKLAEQIEQYLRTNYNQRVTNQTLQQHFNYHPNYLSKCMRRVYGRTPLEYLKELRLDQARKRLIQTDDPITVIAEEVGMQLSSFSIAFTKKEGLSPYHFRSRYTRRETGEDSSDIK
ncbi:AraC family transcriptional regulator [Paenibacillus sp. JX-17]|uniref:AraC family transcriptional regulator n=1 Tax=Paenibacillus lacisoli TaxID=3064525 RepID=A0ABT9CFL1_9BACL|nr:AraC family transcriptional regulator [Paenibacillus sp. JX-17]MDO7908057.1 AraC family transcriptional regulator [Paenibacillus sp. JX-17]